MQKGKYLEAQVEKVIEYIEKLGFHGHKNHPERLNDGTYIEGEPFDFELFYKDRHEVFDTKECKTDKWHILPKDIRQCNELKKCKNAGLKAYFLICFEGKDVRELDVDIVIEHLKRNVKTISKEGLPKWELIKIIGGIQK